MKRRDFIVNTSAILGSSLIESQKALSATSKRSNSNDLGDHAETSQVATLRPPLRRGRPATITLPPSTSPPPLSLDQLHALMVSVCRDGSGNQQVGAFFRIDWLVSNLATQFKDAASAIAKMVYQTPFKSVSASLKIDFTNAGISNRPQTDITIDAQGKISLTDFCPVVVLTDPHSKIYNQIAIEFNPVSLKMNLDTMNLGNLRFYLTTNDPSDPAFPTFNVVDIGANPPTLTGPDPNVLAANGYTSSTWAQLETSIEAAEAPLDILDSFIASLPTVPIMEAMRQFDVGLPLNFHFEQGYVIVHGPTVTKEPELCGPKAGTTVATTIAPTPNPTSPSSPGHNGFQFAFKHTVSSPILPTVIGTTDPPFGYYYPINFTFGDFANSIIGPGVVASDSGDAFLFHWAYQLSARPKPQSISVTIPANPNAAGFLAQIDINAPLDIGGGAGVSMKVGCVTVPLLSSTILGSVNPSKLTLTLKIVNGGDGPELVVLPQYDCNVNVTFYGPPMIDVLLNIIMASFGDRLVSGAIRNMVNKLSFPIVNLSALDYKKGQSGYGWRLGQHFLSRSILVTLEQGRTEH
jgi:hypothetical protein